MTEDARCERTATLLSARLEALARAAAQLPRSETERLLELAAVATARAVALGLLDTGRAEAIWGRARERHPALSRGAPRGAALRAA